MTASSSTAARSLSALSLAVAPRSPQSTLSYNTTYPRRLTSSASRSWLAPVSSSSSGVHTPPSNDRQQKPARRRQTRPGGDAHNHALYHFRLALTQADLEKAWHTRQKLEESGNLHTIREVGRRDLRKLLERARIGLASPGGLDLEECAKILVQQEIKSAIETTRNPEIVQWMIHYIRAGKEDAAMSLAYQCIAALDLQTPLTRKGKGKAAEVRQEDSKESPLLLDDGGGQEELEDEPFRTTQDGRLLVPTFLPDMLILLAFLTKDKKVLLSLVRKLPMPDRTKLWIFSKSRIEKLMREIRPLPDRSQNNVQEQVEDLIPTIYAFELAWGLDSAQEQVKTNLLAQLFGIVLGKSNFRAVNGLLDALIEGTKGTEAWLSVSGISTLNGPPHEPADVDDSVWSTLLSGSLSKDRADIASRVWSHLTSLGLKPSPQLYNALLKGYAQLGKWDALESVWGELMDQSHTNTGPDIFCYTTMISALFRARRPDDAMDLFEDLKTKGVNPSYQLTVTSVAYNAVIFGLLKTDRPERAMAILETMLSPTKPSSVPDANTSTLNTILRAHARSGDLAALTDTLAATEKWKVTPDVVTYTTVLDALIRHGAPGSSAQAVTAVHGMMRAHNINMSMVTWTTLLKGLLSDTSSSMGDLWEVDVPDSSTALNVKREQIVAGLALVEEMVENGHRPNEVTWTALMQAGCDLQRILSQDRDASTVAVAERLSAAAPKTNLGRFLTAVAPLKESNHSIALLRSLRPGDFLVLSILEAMRRDYIQPNRRTYHFLLTSLLRAAPIHPLSRDSVEAARTVFIRGLSVLDHFCTSLFTATSHPSSSPPSPSTMSAGVTPLHRSGSAPIELRNLVPPASTPIGSRKAGILPPEPTDVSMRVILEALLNRFDSLVLAARQVRAAMPRAPSYSAVSGSTNDHAAGSALTQLQQVEAEVSLTKEVMREALVRLKVLNLLKLSGREGMREEGSSAFLARMRERVTSILDSEAR